MTLEQTEKAADRIRSELLSTLEELELRRGRATDWRYQAAQHKGTLLLSAGVLLLSLGFGASLSRARARRRSSGLFRQRVRALVQAWRDPRLLAAPPPRSLPREIALRAACSFSSALAGRLARRAADRLLPGM